MANDIMAMDSLKEEAIRVYPGIAVVFPQTAQEETLNISDLAPKFNGCYAVNNSTVCFVSENEIFAIPQTRLVIRSLHSAGFRQEHFYVPFSNWDYPKREQAKWKYLQEKARASYEDDFAEDCISYCDKHNIGTLSDETLQNCFEMPNSGVPVKRLYFEDCYFPVINSTCFDSVAADHIGHFCTNNGKVIFVYQNGKTYVAKGYKILNELRGSGYTEAGMFVPFSNGEQILDSALKARWESITK